MGARADLHDVADTAPDVELVELLGHVLERFRAEGARRCAALGAKPEDIAAAVEIIRRAHAQQLWRLTGARQEKQPL